MPDKTSPTTPPTICPLHPNAVFDDNVEAIGNDRDIDLEHHDAWEICPDCLAIASTHGGALVPLIPVIRKDKSQ